MKKNYIQSAALHLSLLAIVLLISNDLKKSIEKEKIIKPIELTFGTPEAMPEEKKATQKENKSESKPKQKPAQVTPKQPSPKPEPLYEVPAQSKSSQIDTAPKAPKIAVEKANPELSKPQSPIPDKASEAIKPIVAINPIAAPKMISATQPLRPSSLSAPIQKATVTTQESAPQVLKQDQLQTRAHIESVHAVKPSTPNISPKMVTALQQPNRPSTLSAPMQKGSLSTEEPVPQTLKQDKSQTHQYTDSVQMTKLNTINTESKQPTKVPTPIRPTALSVPMEKAVAYKTESAPNPIVSKPVETVKAETFEPIKDKPVKLTQTIIPTKPNTLIASKPNTISPIVSGTKDEIGEAKKGYGIYLKQLIEKHKTYPKEAKENENQMGTVTVKFRIAKDGRLIKSAVVKSSGYKALDQASLDLLKKIGKFDPIPDILNVSHMDYTLDIEYSLK